MTIIVEMVTGVVCMPRGFTEDEKRNIRAGLVKSGIEAFGRWGIKKTSVEELASMAGISKGAFYLFFSSKEDLYFNILREFESGIHAGIIETLSGETEDSRQLLKKVFLEIIRQIDEVPFIKALFEKKEYQYLQQKLTPEQIEEAMNADVDLSTQLTGILEQKGKLKLDNPEFITGFFRAVFFMTLHKEDIGENVFQDVIELMLDAGLDSFIGE